MVLTRSQISDVQKFMQWDVQMPEAQVIWCQLVAECLSLEALQATCRSYLILGLASLFVNRVAQVSRKAMHVFAHLQSKAQILPMRC